MILRILILMAFGLLPFTAYTQPEKGKTKSGSKPTIFQHFYNDLETTVPKLILTVDTKRLIKNKFKADTIKGRLQVISNGQTEEWTVKVNARGKSRRKICYMPPLKLKFSKKELKAKKIRKKYNDLKLVSYCRNQDNYEGIVLREYMAYKLYNALTDYSFNVQLVEIEYRDSSGRMAPVKRHGFLIENTDELANRLNAKEKSVYELERKNFDSHQYDLLAIFQYMISNTDWKISALHNIKLIVDKDTKIAYPIPYDFDYSGFVNAVYAVPNPDYSQTHVRDRYYMGECKSVKELKAVQALYINKKEDLLSCKNCAPLSSKKCKRTKKFIKSFYKIIEKDKKFKRKCLK